MLTNVQQILSLSQRHLKEDSMLGTTDTVLAMSTIILCSWTYGLLVYMFATWGDD